MPNYWTDGHYNPLDESSARFYQNSHCIFKVNGITSHFSFFEECI